MKGQTRTRPQQQGSAALAFNARLKRNIDEAGIELQMQGSLRCSGNLQIGAAMRRSESRIAFALVGVFVWLGVFTPRYAASSMTPGWFRWGVLAIILGAATFVIALNPLANRGSRK
ncbi:DUF2964 family protein [Paraburkholderia kirstenboschensis]|jgi:hypothetical protein|uniref:DUF2964 family protein n=1 Tax=Paraburkholderia kirstenboschensis TaxID=1245436 RepID=A0ABZ0EGF2_9BURK|nr:DUF2964 family protein [Paraburkholderia kirstenboschensis]WOD16271.1 DUF2964 family protein [Paraburkholderia kirstenboschensis]